MQFNIVFKYKRNNRWIINYDELDPVVDENLAEKDNEKADKKPQEAG